MARQGIGGDPEGFERSCGGQGNEADGRLGATSVAKLPVVGVGFLAMDNREERLLEQRFPCVIEGAEVRMEVGQNAGKPSEHAGVLTPLTWQQECE